MNVSYGSEEADVSGPSVLERVGSAVVKTYLRGSPIERGKFRLRDFAGTRFLFTRLEGGLWIRVSGASGLEWKVLRGHSIEGVTTVAFRGLVRPGMTVFDVGANVGYYAMTAAALMGGSGSVHAFEPTPAVAQRLRQNVDLNGIKTVIINAVAVGEMTGKLGLRLNADDSEGNSLVAFGDDWAAVEVPVTTLDDYTASRGVSTVDVLKIDVEGAEVSVLRGARRLLGGDAAPLILIEFNPLALHAAGTSPVLLQSALRELGYDCFGLEQLTRGDDPVHNILAAKSSHRTRFPALGALGLEPFQAENLRPGRIGGGVR